MDKIPDSTSSDHEVEFITYDDTLQQLASNVEEEHFNIKKELKTPFFIWSLSIQYRIFVLNNTYFPRAYKQSAIALYTLLKINLPYENFIPYYFLPHDILSYPEYRNHPSQLNGKYSNSPEPLGFIRDRHRLLLAEIYTPIKHIKPILRFPPRRNFIKIRRFSL